MKHNQETPKIHERNRVIIRVWTSGYNKTIRGENVGHISLEVLDNYMSLWPQPRNQTDDASSRGKGRIITSIFEERPAQYMFSYQNDETAEGRKPEYTICLYSLNQEAIIEKFKELKSTVKGWTLLGANRLINSGSSESCASLAYQLLKAGGIYNSISSSYSSENSIVTSPDSLSEAVLAAKKYELRHHPEIKEYECEGEFEIEDQPINDQPTSKDKCLTM